MKEKSPKSAAAPENAQNPPAPAREGHGSRSERSRVARSAHKSRSGDERAEGDVRIPIVGLGASAGGLEAFQQFLREMPADSGMAFVLVQHLDPGHASFLSDILRHTTAMPVVEAENRMPVEPNHVYVIPPNREMRIERGQLLLSVPEIPHNLRMPIDTFLRSLADERGEQSLGIILSGSGTDGTLGLRAILGAGGVTLVQDPATAKFGSMPASAIKGGYATQILPTEKMPEALLTDVRILAVRGDVQRPTRDGLAIDRILAMLRSQTGHDFSLYKRSTIGRRIERRMVQCNVEDLEQFATHVEEHPAEIKMLFKELLINVTCFFRDPEAFDVLEQDILPKLLADKPDDYSFRVWIAGGATGEEAFSIAILLAEYMERHRKEFSVQIYSTDLDDDAIGIARTATYPPNIVQDIRPDRLQRFFVKENDSYRVRKEIREMVVFATQNVLSDPPFTKLDLLSCRNVMIYLEPELQSRLIPLYHYALKPGGILFLSPSESIGRHAELFTPLSRKWKFYRAERSATSTRAVLSSGLSWAATINEKVPGEMMKKSKENNLAELARRLLLQSFAPASVLTDMKGNILYVYGETGKYLRPAPGEATLNIIEMAHLGLQLVLREAFRNAADMRMPLLNQEVSINNNGDLSPIGVSLRPLLDSDGSPGWMLVSFQDVDSETAARKPRRQRLSKSLETRRNDELQRELAYTKENLQAAVEEQQASNEELKSTNEELQSTNEEMQSANEELETSREELQSVNEELVTVNGELQAKIEQMAGMQNDMKNLLDNVQMGILFLDTRLSIRRFTRGVTRIYRLVEGDIGRPLNDIRSDLTDESLLTDARTVLDSLLPIERELQSGNGSWYLVRIQPYRTIDNVIDGVVLTFADITERIRALDEQRRARELAEGIIDAVCEPLVVLDGDLGVVSANAAFYQDLNSEPSNVPGVSIFEIGDGRWNDERLRAFLDGLRSGTASAADCRVEGRSADDAQRPLVISGRRLVDIAGIPMLIVLTLKGAAIP